MCTLPTQHLGRDLASAAAYAWNVARVDAERADEQRETAWGALRQFVQDNPEHEGLVDSIVEEWTEYYFPEEHRDTAQHYWLYLLTGSEDRRRQVQADLDAVGEGRKS